MGSFPINLTYNNVYICKGKLSRKKVLWVLFRKLNRISFRNGTIKKGSVFFTSSYLPGVQTPAPTSLFDEPKNYFTNK